MVESCSAIELQYWEAMMRFLQSQPESLPKVGDLVKVSASWASTDKYFWLCGRPNDRGRVLQIRHHGVVCMVQWPGLPMERVATCWELEVVKRGAQEHSDQTSSHGISNFNLNANNTSNNCNDSNEETTAAAATTAAATTATSTQHTAPASREIMPVVGQIVEFGSFDGCKIVEIRGGNQFVIDIPGCCQVEANRSDFHIPGADARPGTPSPPSSRAQSISSRSSVSEPTESEPESEGEVTDTSSDATWYSILATSSPPGTLGSNTSAFDVDSDATNSAIQPKKRLLVSQHVRRWNRVRRGSHQMEVALKSALPTSSTLLPRIENATRVSSARAWLDGVQRQSVRDLLTDDEARASVMLLPTNSVPSTWTDQQDFE